MTTAYRSKPLSEILAPAADPEAQAQTDVKPAAAVAESYVPEKYRGKDVLSVIEMHQNAEQRLGQLQNEVGQLRGLVTDLSALQRPTPASQTAQQETIDVSSDDLLTDPVAAVRKIVQPEFDRRDAEKDKLAAETIVETEGAALLREFGNLDAIVASEGFQKFAQRTASRQADLVTAAQGHGLQQVRAARRLLEDYNDFQQATSSEKKTESGVDKARKVATESGGSGAPISSKPQIFESDVITLINSDPMKYRSPSFQKQLVEAIKEGRFVANT